MHEFSVHQHTQFLAGYVDAVARSATTNAEVFCISANYVEVGCAQESQRDSVVVDNWSAEFGSLVEDFLGLSQRSRLGFYLVDYICWFRDFTEDANCVRVTGDPTERIYHVGWRNGARVVLAASRRPRTATDNSFKDQGSE